MNRPDDSPNNSILIYTTEDGLTKIDTTFDGDTVWLSIDQMAELFQRNKSTISRHIKNIFAEGELERDSVVAKFATTAADGKTYQVENTEGKGFANEPMRGNLKIVKTSSDGKVEGFAFRITGANGYDVTLETDEKGEIFIEGLRIGEYKISEVNNAASAMYILPADKEAAVQTGSTTVVEMHNELRDTPKTGDDSKLGLWLALAGVSMAGIAACGIFGFKKKKKKEDN